MSINPSAVRAAAYLDTQARLDKKGPKCNPPNRVCGNRCIPPAWKCRVKGEGTDSHSRVVAGDPLAGAASISRGRARLFKGLQTGNVTDLQAGRAAVVRGIVKSVPGQNLKQKQQLRKNVENLVIPVATGLFTVWALRQGHEAAKVLFPAYEKGPAKNVEGAANSAISRVLDTIPFYGSYRKEQRTNAYLRGELLARSINYGVRNNPEEFTNNAEAFPNVSRTKVAGLRDAIESSIKMRDPDGLPPTYTNFRASTLSSILGARVDGKNGSSVYTEPATIDFLSKQYGVDRSKILGSDSTAKKRFLLNQMTSTLRSTGLSMRADMFNRGLDPNKPEDVDNYAETALSNVVRRSGSAAGRSSVFQGMKTAQLEESFSVFRGSVRELVGSPATIERGARALATRQYDETSAAFDSYFKEAAKRIANDVSPTRSVVAFPAGDSPLSSTLIGVAERLKSRVRISAPITGANHAELVMQRVYHEVVATPSGRFNPRSTGTWAASDKDIIYAAQDMGWDGVGSASGAFAFLQRSGQFPRLARSTGPTSTPRSRPQPPEPGRRRQTTRLRTEAEIAAMLVRAGRSEEAARTEAAAIVAKRKKS